MGGGGESVPLYEYECVKCGRRTEKIENVDGPHLRKCPHCGGKVERLVSAPAIQFKGSGWYVTDYGGENGRHQAPQKAKAGGRQREGGTAKTPDPKTPSNKAGQAQRRHQKNRTQN